MKTIYLLLAMTLTTAAFADKNSFKPAEEAKKFIDAENSKIHRSPNADYEKIHQICGKPWYVGCVWKSAGTNKWTFQKLEKGKPTGKIYDVPGFLTR